MPGACIAVLGVDRRCRECWWPFQASDRRSSAARRVPGAAGIRRRSSGEHLLRQRAVGGGGAVVVDRRDEIARDAERLVDLVLDLLGHLGVLVEVGLRVVAPLAETLVAVGEERPGLADAVVLEAEIDQAPGRRDPPAERNSELGVAERRRDLVLAT